MLSMFGISLVCPLVILMVTLQPVQLEAKGGNLQDLFNPSSLIELPFLGKSSVEPLLKSLSDNQLEFLNPKNSLAAPLLQLVSPAATSKSTTSQETEASGKNLTPSPVDGSQATTASPIRDSTTSSPVEQDGPRYPFEELTDTFIQQPAQFGTNIIKKVATEVVKTTGHVAAAAINPLSIKDGKKTKYFSVECQFRVACEVGKLMKPFAAELAKVLETSKVIQDLQNRYTRSFTYGMAHSSCDRYYCLFLQLFNGPESFAKGLTEMINRMANPELYEGMQSIE